MKRSINLRFLCLLMGLAGLLAGCPKMQLPTYPETHNAVDWAQSGSGAFIQNQDRLFYGIGRAEGSRNATLLRAAADNQARTEMERVLRAYFGRLIDATGWQGESDERQQMIYGLSQAALQRARITDHRFDQPNQTLFALCSLPLTAVAEALQTSPYIGNTLKREMLGRAEDVHQQRVGTH